MCMRRCEIQVRYLREVRVGGTNMIQPASRPGSPIVHRKICLLVEQTPKLDSNLCTVKMSEKAVVSRQQPAVCLSTDL